MRRPRPSWANANPMGLLLKSASNSSALCCNNLRAVWSRCRACCSECCSCAISCTGKCRPRGKALPAAMRRNGSASRQASSDASVTPNNRQIPMVARPDHKMRCSAAVMGSAGNPMPAFQSVPATRFQPAITASVPNTTGRSASLRR